MKKVIDKNFIWNFMGLSITAFNSLFFLIIVNRINGQVDGGVFTYAFSLVCLTYFIGTYYNRTYQISNQNNYNTKEYILNRIGSCITMILITFIITLIFQYNSYKTCMIMSLCLYKMFESFSETLYAIEMSHNQLYKSGISMFFKGIFSVIAFLVTDLITKDIILSIMTISVVNILLILFYDIKNCKQYITGSINVKNILGIYKYALPIFVFTFLNNYLINSAKYTLDFFESATIQNVFGIILMPGTIMGLCAGYILNPYLLELNNLYKEKKLFEFKNKLYKIFKIILAIGIIGFIGCYLFGIPVLNIIYDTKLDSYKSNLLIIIVGAIFLAISMIYSNALTILDKNNIQMYLYIINSVLSLMLSIVLIKNYKITGAAITYFCTMLLEAIEYYVVFKYYYKKMNDKKTK